MTEGLHGTPVYVESRERGVRELIDERQSQRREGWRDGGEGKGQEGCPQRTSVEGVFDERVLRNRVSVEDPQRWNCILDTGPSSVLLDSVGE